MNAQGFWLFTDAPYAGGAEQYLTWLLEAAGPSRAGLVAVDRPGLKGWLRLQETRGFVVERIRPGRRLFELRQFHDWIRRRRPGLLHVNLPGPYDGLLALAPAVARAGGAGAVVVTEHLPGLGRVGKRYWAKRMSLSAIDRAITVCAAHRNVLLEVFGYRPERVVAIPNGVPDPNPAGRIAAAARGELPADLAARETTDDVRLVQVGSLDGRKGGDVLIAAASLLRGQGVRFSLWLVGEGPARPAWEREVGRQNLQGCVHFAGNRDDVPRIWAAADVAVLASHREGMPLSLLEACAHGLPIAASRVDGIGEIVEPHRTGLLVEAGDSLGLAAALGELCRDRDRRTRWGRRARRRFEARFRLERMIEATFAVYEAVRPGSAPALTRPS